MTAASVSNFEKNMRKYIMLYMATIAISILLTSCSNKAKEESIGTGEVDETEICLDDEKYNDVCYYFEDELNEDVENIELDEESGLYFVHTTSSLTYTIMNMGGGMYTIYDTNGNSMTSMDLGGGMRVASDNYGNTYNTMDLGGGMSVTTDNNGNTYNTMDLGGGMTITTDNNGNSYNTMDLGGGMTVITDNEGNSTTIMEY